MGNSAQDFGPLFKANQMYGDNHRPEPETRELVEVFQNATHYFNVLVERIPQPDRNRVLEVGSRDGPESASLNDVLYAMSRRGQGWSAFANLLKKMRQKSSKYDENDLDMMLRHVEAWVAKARRFIETPQRPVSAQGTTTSAYSTGTVPGTTTAAQATPKSPSEVAGRSIDVANSAAYRPQTSGGRATGSGDMIETFRRHKAALRGIVDTTRQDLGGAWSQLDDLQKLLGDATKRLGIAYERMSNLKGGLEESRETFRGLDAAADEIAAKYVSPSLYQQATLRAEQAEAQLVTLRSERDNYFHQFTETQAEAKRQRSDAVPGIINAIDGVMDDLAEFSVDISGKHGEQRRSSGNPELDYLHSAQKTMVNKLLNVLEQSYGLRKIEPLRGESFDPSKMKEVEAIAPDKREYLGRVARVVKYGFEDTKSSSMYRPAEVCIFA